MMVAHEEYGQLPWSEIIQPVVDIVRSGVYVTETNRGALQDNSEKIIGYSEAGFLNEIVFCFINDTIQSLKDIQIAWKKT